MNLPKLSCTQITMAKRCERKLYHVLTQPKPPKMATPLYIGSVFHEVLEQNFKHKVDTGRDFRLDQLNGIFNQTWDSMKWKADFSKMSELEAKSKCLNYVQTYWGKRCSFLYPKDKESIEIFFGFNANMEDRKIRITGKIDLIDRSNTIIDHKTSSRAWSQEEANREPQAYLYPLGMKANKRAVQGFQFSVVCGGSVEIFPVQYNPGEASRLLAYAFDLQRNFETENLLATKSQRTCSWCEWNSICKQKIG